ncbi:MAG TPA: MATE family efflux transporter [Methylomirabilota bacterium]|nr:MATE family efflux transporter [Methylomirabilota bacterium]
MKQRSQGRFLVWCREGRRTLSLALPITAGFVGQMLMGLADTLMVGQVGTVPLAAAAFGHALTHIPLVTGLGLLTAMAVLTAHAFGGGRRGAAGEVLRHGLVIAGCVGVISGLGTWWVRTRVGWLGQPGEVVEAAQTYLVLVGWSLLPVLVAHGLKQFSEALSRPWPPMVILLAGVLLNVGLNWLWIYGHWGFPAMGLDGAGLATLVSRILVVVAMAVYVWRSPRLREWLPVAWLARASWRSIREQLALGWPVALQHLLEVGAFVSAALMMGWISAEAIAAHQIAITCAATTFTFALGIGLAVSIRVGHAWGAGALRRLRRVGFSGIVLAGGLMSGFAVLFLVAAYPIAGAFTPSREVVALTAAMLLVAAWFQVFDGVQVVAMSALRGMGDVRVPAVVAGVAYWGLALPVGYGLAFGMGMGAAGIWVGLAAGLASAATVLSFRFHRVSARHRGRTGEAAAGKNHLTGGGAGISLSAFVDKTDLMKSG